MRCFSVVRRIVAALCVVVAGLAVLEIPGSAIAKPSYNVIYAFCPAHDGNCPDGSIPKAGIVRDAQGNFYGTTWTGGETGQNKAAGTVYQVTPTGVETVLHTFCNADCKDGSTPLSQLIIDTDGNLYGTTQFGGIHNGGTVFELSRSKSGEWKFSVLYSFCSKANCADGKTPVVGLGYRGAENGTPYDGRSKLFGVTISGGGKTSSAGVVFSLKPGRGQTFKEKVIYVFCSSNNCGDGSSPAGTPTFDANGNLFGTLLYGGPSNAGGIYELVPSGKNYTYTLLYSFCSLGLCTDGRVPYGPVVLDPAGDLYGTTLYGGDRDSGVLFKIVPNGANSQETVLHSFCSKFLCADGNGPIGGVTIDSSGSLFGATNLGGANGGGTLYSFKDAKLTVLYSFGYCLSDGCPQGGNPLAGVVLDSAGNLFGTAQFNSANQEGGVIYEFKP